MQTTLPLPDAVPRLEREGGGSSSFSDEEIPREPAPKRRRMERPKLRKEYTTKGYVCEFVETNDVMEGEIWAKVPEQYGADAYVSNFGRFESCYGVVDTPTPRKDGYATVRIRGKQSYMHRVVLEAFGVLPPSSEHTYVNHKDGNPSNNRLENLEWCTQSQNIAIPSRPTRTGDPTRTSCPSPCAPSAWGTRNGSSTRAPGRRGGSSDSPEATSPLPAARKAQ
jgi:hypothetical protein